MEWTFEKEKWGRKLTGGEGRIPKKRAERNSLDDPVNFTGGMSCNFQNFVRKEKRATRGGDKGVKPHKQTTTMLGKDCPNPW